MLDNAVLEVMVRSVALAAFVETPRNTAVVPKAEPRSTEMSVSLVARLGEGLKALGAAVANAVTRLRGASEKQPSPNGCVPAC